MSTTNPLSKMLEQVYLGGLIEECVMAINKNTASVMAVDLSGSLFMTTSTQYEHDNDIMGLGNLSLLIKYFKSYSGEDIEVTRNDNRLTIKPKGGATLKFLLSEASLIPTFNENWENKKHDDYVDMSALMKGFSESAKLSPEKVAEFLNLTKLFGPESVIVSINKKGRISISGGHETEHQFTVDMGKSKLTECSQEVYREHLVAVLNTLNFGEGTPAIYIQEDMPVVVVSNNATWVLSPLGGA